MFRDVYVLAPAFMVMLAKFCQWRKDTTRLFTSVKELPVLLLGLKRDLRSEDDPNAL
jgi:hypothetical protein